MCAVQDIAGRHQRFNIRAEEEGGLMVEKIECRGWKEIMEFLGVKTVITARALLKRNGLYAHDGRTVVLNVLAYHKASLRRHLKNK
jgi:hypothetical protein